MPGRRQATIELAAEIERRGFTGLYCPSFGDGLALSVALAQVTREIPFGTGIANIYTRHPADFAQTAAFVHETSGGRFRFGVGVSHTVTNTRLGLKTGTPLADMRRFVTDLRAAAGRFGNQPPLILATLRRKMVELAGEVGQGAMWANAARSHMPASLQALPPEKRADDFFIGNMIPTCVAEDRAAAAAVDHREQVVGPVGQPARALVAMGHEGQRADPGRELVDRVVAHVPDRHGVRGVAERVVVRHRADAADAPVGEHFFQAADERRFGNAELAGDLRVGPLH